METSTATDLPNAVESTATRIRQSAREGIAKVEATEDQERARQSVIRTYVFERVVEIAAERGMGTSVKSISESIAEGLKQSGIEASSSEVKEALKTCGVDVNDDFRRI